MNDDLYYAYEKPKDDDPSVELSDAWCVVLLIMLFMTMCGWW